MHHPRYCLTHHPGISSNITNATHFSTPATPTTLAHRPLYPRWCTTHATHAGTSPQHAVHHNPRQHVTHTGSSPTPARHQRKHTTHVSTPPTQARHPRHSRQHKQHAISQTPGYPVKLLKLLGLKFQEEIQQFLLLLFIFTTFKFQAFLSIFIEVQKTVIEKLNFFRGNQSALLKRRLFLQKQMCQFFRKKCFLILVSLRPFYIF